MTLTVELGQFRYPAVQRYLHDLTAEMGEHLDHITSSLSMFLEIGVQMCLQPFDYSWFIEISLHRYSNHPIRAKACREQLAEPHNHCDLLLCGYGHDSPTLIRFYSNQPG